MKKRQLFLNNRNMIVVSLGINNSNISSNKYILENHPENDSTVSYERE